MPRVPRRASTPQPQRNHRRRTHRGEREQIQSPSARIRTPLGWIQLLPAGTGTAAKEEVSGTKTRTMEEGR
jgi:hypothetical protein